jgi:hypothetical protein
LSTLLFFHLLLPALAVLTGCASSHHQLDPLLASRTPIRTLKVAETKCWSPEFVEEELLAYLKGCGAHVESGTETADLVIRWQEEQCGVCLDFWAPSCDVLKLKADLETVDGAHATWIRRLPVWCAEEEQCLLKLFARDLGALLCHRPVTGQPHRPATAPATQTPRANPPSHWRN